jgi:hypothetical protein
MTRSHSICCIVASAALAAAMLPGAAGAQEGCTTDAAENVMNTQLLPYADEHAPEFFEQYGGAGELDYTVGTRICRDLTGDGDLEMIVHAQCCTGGSPSPWGIFVHDAQGAWSLAYARAVDTVFRLRLSGRAVRADMPAPYEGACTRFLRSRVVSWDESRFRSRLQHRRRVTNGC